MKVTAAAVLGGLMALAAGEAKAACGQVELTPSASTWSIAGYDPFGADTPRRDFSITVHNRGQDVCQFEMAILRETERFGLQGARGESINYGLIDITSNSDVTPVLGQSSVALAQRAITLAPGSQELFRYSFFVDENDIVGDGRFDQRIMVSARELGSQAVLDEEPIDLVLDVKPSAVIRLAGEFTRSSAGIAGIDLGPLRTGTVPTTANVVVSATRNYQVSVSSANRGRLRLGTTDWSVPYGLLLGAQSVNLGQVSSVSVLGADGALRQDSHPLSFVVGEISENRAGRYSDTLTLTVSPL